MSGDSEVKRLCGMCQRMHDAADPKDGRPPDEQLEDLLGYMDVLEEAIDRAGVGDEARARDKPRAVDEAIDILFEQREDLTTDLAAARGANLVLARIAHRANERTCREHERAGKLEDALEKTLESFREEDCSESKDCNGCTERDDCEITPGLDALDEYRKGME